MTSTVELFKSYGVLIGCIATGIAIHIFAPNWVSFLEPFGTIYGNFLTMWALPIMFASSILAVFKFFCQGNLQTKANDIFLVSGLTLLLAIAIVMAIDATLHPGQNLSPETLELLGSLINDAGNTLNLELFAAYDTIQNDSNTLIGFLSSIIPENIFVALSQGIIIQVVVFAILFGLILGWSNAREGDELPNLLELIYETITQITEWAGVLAPLGLCIEIASLSGELNWNSLLGMKDFLPIVFVLFFAVSIFSIGLLWKQSRVSLPSLLSAIGEPSLLVLSSQEGITAIPASIRVLHCKLHFDRETVDLIVPLAATIFRVGSFIYLLLVIFFIAGLYQVHFSPPQFAIAIVGVMLFSTATSTATGGGDIFALIIPIAAVLDLPFDGIVVPLIAIDLLLQPFRELVTIYTSMAIAAAIATGGSGERRRSGRKLFGFDLTF
ncbi:MAG: cation:dicarboxylase symporter family transporter [Cyanobacteria bacterium P01_E01_bin.42]